jgi:hypothetical protein
MNAPPTRFVRRAIAALTVLTLLVVLAEPLSAADPPAGGGSAPLFERLQGERVDAAYHGESLESVVEDLRDRLGLNVHVAWARLREIGVRRDQPVTVDLRQVTLRTLLDMLVRDLGVDVDRVDYDVHDDVLVISTDVEVRRRGVLRTYDVADLLESGYALRRFTSTPVLRLKVSGYELVGGEPESGGGGGGGMGGGGGSVFGEPRDDLERGERMERVQGLIDLIQEHVDPDSWRNMGGDAGSIAVRGNTLFIHHTPRGHDEVERFLDLVRSSRPRNIDADVVLVRLFSDRLPAAMGSAPRMSAERFDALMNGLATEDALFRATTSGHAGERLWFSSVAQREVLASAAPVIDEGTSAFQPVTNVVTEGFELILLPLAAPGSDEVTLDVQMAWIPNTEMLKRDVRLAPDDGKASIDLVTRRMRTVSTTVSTAFGEGVALSIPQSPNTRGQPWEDWLLIRVRAPSSE